MNRNSSNNDDDDVFEMGPGAMDLVERQQSPSNLPTFSFTNTSDEDEEITPEAEGKKVSFPDSATDFRATGNKLDPKYSTIQSCDSAVSRESSTAMFGPYDMWSSGIIQFLMLGGDVNDKDRYYVCVPKEATVDNIADFIAYRWKKRSPKVVLSLITNTKYFKAWKNEVQVEDFQRGIIEAANLTEMWVLTDGLDSGMSKLIGNAVAEELARRSSLELDHLHIENTWVREKLPKLTVIGVVSKSEISYGSYLDGQSKESVVTPCNHRNLIVRETSSLSLESTYDDWHNEPKSVENVGQKPHLDRFELNPDHTHFILAEDMSKQEMINLRFNIEQRFLHSVGRPRRYRRMTSSHTTIPGSDLEVNDVPDKDYNEDTSTPVIGLLIQGGPPDIDHCLWLLKKRIPIILLKGSGLAADLIAFAYEEHQERSDKEHFESYLKPELMKKVMSSFPNDFKNNDLARNQCRDRILECIQFAHQGEQTYLTIIDPSAGADLGNLSKFILNALFKSQPHRGGPHLREQIQRDLQLTLDWNRCDLAKSKIFQKFNHRKIKVEDYIFHQALQRHGREEFVELFLEKGFLVHRFLNHKRLHHLFENCQDREFFIGICLEGVLSKTVNTNTTTILDKKFVEDDTCELNHLLYRCTRLQKLVSPYELSMNSLGDYISNKEVAERRAINTLLLWATLTNRQKLAKVIWKRTDDPMAIALIVSMILNNLTKYWCKDIDIKKKTKLNADEFGKMAVQLLNLCYEDSSVQAFNALDKQLQDFNLKTVVEIAKLANNKFFLAHPCCQKWLGQRWHGQVQIRDLDWGIRLPDWFKIYASVFLIFPMFVWISFKSTPVVTMVMENEEEEDEDACEDNFLLQSTTITPKRKRRPASKVIVKIHNLVDRGETKLPVWKQIFLLWSAPITKFWINQLFYVLFLATFSLATLMPTCGNVFLNFVVFAWTTMIWVEITRGTWVKKWKYPEVPIFRATIEIGLILIFLLLYLVFRILPHFVDHINYMTAKFLMSIGLLFFYYRTLSVFLPISPTLGPMLICIIRMIRKDFFTWFRMFMIVMVSGGLTIHAVIYPNYPVSLHGIKKAFARAFFAMFLTKIDDLDGDEKCSHLYSNVTDEYCLGPSHFTDSDQQLLAECPYGSFGGYFIVIQYLVITKLVLVTLLYAMFSVTNAAVSREALEIWKYQRYGIIVDFEERLRLPPPFTCISYLFMFLSFLLGQCRKLKNRMATSCAKCCKKDTTDGVKNIQILKKHRTTDFNYWKRTVKQYISLEKEKKEKDEREEHLIESVHLLTDEMNAQKDGSKRMSDRIVTLERGITSCCLMLEEVKHMLEKLDPKTQTDVTSRAVIHFSARQSPYPGTRIQRFPVFDKYVPWEVEFITYDPVIYTKQIKEFPPDIQMFVDPDILLIKKLEDERKQLKPDELEDLPEVPEFNPWWNSHCSVDVDGGHIEIDRCSYIHDGDQPYRYKIDKSGLPKNPLGRTGIRGRGKLWRWGPNHRIAALVTRWKRKYSTRGFPTDYIMIEDKKVLEFMVIKRVDTGEYTLPGGNVYGKTTQFSTLCEQFMKDILEQAEVDAKTRLEEEDMIDFFAQFATSSLTPTLSPVRPGVTAKGFSASVLYRGYIDDPSNTDNAWRETIVWNFHYGLSDTFDEKITDKENLWKDVSSYTHLFGNQDSIVQEAAKLHGAYF